MSASPSQFPPNILKETRVLVVDDEDMLAWSIENELKALGSEVTRAGSLREALERFHQASPDVVITDLRLPDGNGLELLKKWRCEYPDLPMILITAHGAIDSAITALRLGAFDYLQKPFNMKDLLAAVRRSAEVAKLRQKVSRMQAAEAKSPEVEMIGETPAMLELKDQLKRIARSKANTVLILGESGTGKELAARAVHEWSDRCKLPFVEINCASIPETLLESELFGYEKGAFTDARERKLGLFEVARHGSIFLDEIGEMPLKLQAKLLRALEYRRFKRLGGTKDVEFSARIIAATNRNLTREVKAGRFRSDLYYRLNVLPVTIPLLCERAADIPQLARFFCQRLAAELEMACPAVSEEALRMLQEYPWPGNIRELRNVLQRAMVYYEPSVIGPEHIKLDEILEGERRLQGATAALPLLPSVEKPCFPESLPAALPPSRSSHKEINEPGPAWSLAAPFILPNEGISLEVLEKNLLLQALERSRNNQTKAAGLLGISRHALRYRLEKHGLASAE